MRSRSQTREQAPQETVIVSLPGGPVRVPARSSSSPQPGQQIASTGATVVVVVAPGTGAARETRL